MSEKPTVDYWECDNPKATMQRISVSMLGGNAVIQLQRHRKTSRSKWDACHTGFPNRGWLTAEELEECTAALTLAAQIARAWDAGEPLPEEKGERL